MSVLRQSKNSNPPTEQNNNPNTRQATSAITGYLYQFLVTIKKILELTNDNEPFMIEGIEDIDISSGDETQLVQIKYHEEQNFSKSKIYKPIGYMFSHFLENQNNTSINYILYAYFADKTENMTLDIFNNDYLNKCLKKIDKQNTSFQDTDINAFKCKFNFEPAEKYSDTEIATKELLKQSLNCDADDVEKHFYNNALVLIAEMAKDKVEENRKITKKEFLNQINHKQYLFRKWLLEKKGEEAYTKHIKDILRSNNALMTTKKRHLLIDKNIINEKNNNFSVFNLIDNLKLKKSNFKETQLWVVILDATNEEIKKIKSDLIAKEIYFNDGYESIEFSYNYFNRPYHFKTQHNNKGDRIDDASFFIKVISLDTYKEHYKNIDSPCSFISTKESCGFYEKFKTNRTIQFYELGNINKNSILNSIIG